ncbi:hypothetical protein OAM07_06715 [Crocinitomicaceae bacterium]|nr:hypothetical protein [Crocinitomicaceae bacterium]
MKTITSFILFLMMYSYGIGQVKHHDIILGAQYSNQQLLDAVENANWCGYFHQTENYELRFDDGAIVTLKNKSELQSDGNEIFMNENCFQNILTKSEYIHIINSDGWIMVPKEKVITKSKSN